MPAVPPANIPKGPSASSSLDTLQFTGEASSRRNPNARSSAGRRAPEGIPGPLSTRIAVPIQSLPSPERRKLRAGPLGAPSLSKPPAAHSANLQSALRNDGRLENFDAYAFLAQFDGDRAKNIWPPNPAFFWKPVRNNTSLKTAFLELRRALPEIEELCLSIDSGLWGDVEHRIAGKRGVDMLYYAYAAERISALEFATALNVLNMKEQHGLDVSPQYRDKKVSNELISLPARREEWEFFDIFSESGDELSHEGRTYLKTVANNLVQDDHVPRDVRPDELVRDLVRHLRGVPRNLQMGMRVENSVRGTPRVVPFVRAAPGQRQSDLAETNRQIFAANAQAAVMRRLEWAEDPFLYSADQLIPKQVPFNASPDPAVGPSVSRNEHVYVPSSAVMAAALQIFPAPALPAFCLGRVSNRQLAELHVRGFHPVIMRDDRIASNYSNPHGHPAGALHASMHDEFFHCMRLSNHTIEQRRICGETLFNLVDAEVNENSPVEKAFGDEILALLADMAGRKLAGRGPAYFLSLISAFAMRPYLQAMDDKSIEPSAAWNNVKTCAEFLQRVWTRLGEQHPEIKVAYPAEWEGSLDALLGLKERMLEALASIDGMSEHW